VPVIDRVPEGECHAVAVDDTDHVQLPVAIGNVSVTDPVRVAVADTDLGTDEPAAVEPRPHPDGYERGRRQLAGTSGRIRESGPGQRRQQHRYHQRVNRETAS